LTGEIKSTDFAYIAGIVDGGGHFDWVSTEKESCTVPRLIIANNDKAMLEWIVRVVSPWVSHTYLYKQKKTLVSRHDYYHLTIQSRKNFKVLIPLLLPYLKIKYVIAKRILDRILEDD
jgi:hypothetical protein